MESFKPLLLQQIALKYSGGGTRENQRVPRNCGRRCRDTADDMLARLLAASALVVVFAPENSQAQVQPVYSALACETSTIQLNCSIGHSIQIEDGFWGRDNGDTCQVTGNQQASQQRCSSATTRDTLIRRCKGRRSCSVTASENSFGNPCNSNTRKYMRVKYTCHPIIYQALVCENSGRLTLACPGNQLIVTQSALFGRDDNNLTCPHRNGVISTTCRANNSFDIFRELCEGKHHCQVEANIDVFGEPCSGVHKYLRLSYQCADCSNAHNSDVQCEFWANRGNCTNDRNWMFANCRKACSKCDTKPPACANAEGDDAKCEQWAANGYCESSPSYMNAFCRKSCLRCDEKTQCTNKVQTVEDDCQRWTDAGECTNNSPYMLPTCTKSCFQCDTHIRCANTHGSDADCDAWAAAGECRNNTGYMMSRCLKACTGCTSDPDCVNTHGDDVACDEWRQKGECAANPQWMYKYCWKSCMQCAPSTDCVNKYGDDSACNGWAANGDCHSDWMKTQCAKSCVMNVHNNDTECKLWAARGECEANAAWMSTNCRQACQICGKTECRNKIKPVLSCDRWAANGECKANMAWMEQHCSKSCFKCDDVIRCENKDGDAQCNLWTMQGECHANPSYMLTHCLKSCTDCRVDPVCENTHASTSDCRQWAANGECKNYPVWMHKHCWQACLNCTGGPQECANSLGNDAQCESWALQGECQANPAFMLSKCRQSCTSCKPLSTQSDCFNIHGNDTYCDMYARAGHCYTNPNWMLRFCRKSCSMCDKKSLKLGIVGNKAIPGDVNNATRSNTFVLDEFTNGGVLTHFSAFFAGNNTVHLQIWRPDNTTLYPLYDIPFVPAQPKLAQTVLVGDRCVQVQQGDRIGFTSIGNVAPVATNYDVKSLSGKALYRAAAAQQFDNMRLPLTFSLAANYDKTKHC